MKLPPSILRLSIILGCIVAIPTWAQAKSPGTKAVQKANDTIRTLLRKKVQPNTPAEAKLARKVTAEVRQFLDVEELGKRAMRDQWAKLTKVQRKEFTALLRNLIEKNYIKGLRANLQYTVVYKHENSSKDGIVVATEINTKRHNRPYTVTIDYLLREDKGTLRAFDVITDGIGLVENYRAQFNKIIAKEGIDGLLKRMRKKLSKM